MLRSISAVAISAAALTAAPALAQDFYVSGSIGAGFLSDSDNSGAFTSDFATGAGTTIPAGTPLPTGTGVGWTTEFDTGIAASAAIGMRLIDNLRGEIELSYQTNDVDAHSGVAAAGIPLDGEDAGVLITGSSNLGVSVGDLVADGQGSVDAWYLMANVIYDFEVPGSALKPYIGAGAGIAMVDVDYSPSATPIIDDDETAFAYQVLAGVAFGLTPFSDLYAGYRYRATNDIETSVSLFPADLDIENSSSVVEAGVRFYF